MPPMPAQIQGGSCFLTIPGIGSLLLSTMIVTGFATSLGSDGGAVANLGGRVACHRPAGSEGIPHGDFIVGRRSDGLIEPGLQSFNHFLGLADNAPWDP